MILTSQGMIPVVGLGTWQTFDIVKLEADEGIIQMNASFNLVQVNQMDLMQIHNLMHFKTQSCA